MTGRPRPTRRALPAGSEPVFIIGVMNRSGTNYLADLLLRHPDLASPDLIREDYLLFEAHRLDEYVTNTARHWGSEARSAIEEIRNETLARFGEVLLAFAQEACEEGKRLLLKTPRAVNLEYLPRLFPQAKALLVMRDGRDVVESAVRTFKHAGADEWMRRWADGVRRMLAFMRENDRGEARTRWGLVRFEDLFTDPRGEISEALEFLGCDPSRYPWEGIETLPLRGSSTARGGKERVHWEPVPRPRDFKPVGRWHAWGYLRKRQFKRIAGRELVAAGYAETGRW